MKKLRFTDEYERLQDRETYEYMKYKVAAEVGDAEEIETLKLYERTFIESQGEERFRLFAKSAKNEPVLAFLDWLNTYSQFKVRPGTP